MSNEPEEEKLDDEGQEQGFLSHLFELRDRLLRCVLAIILAFACLFPFANEVYTFFAGPLSSRLPEGTTMISTGVVAPFLTPLKLVLMASIFVTVPYLLSQVWGFIAPGLYKSEKRLAVPLLVSSTLLFYIGVAFSYYVVAPLVFGFMVGTTPEGVAYSPDIASYLDFVITMFFAFGIAFEVPIAVILLVSVGMTTPESLASKRPYFIVAAFVVGMFLTPPDVISQTLLALPMWLLFEFGIIFSKIMLRKSEDKKEGADMPIASQMAVGAGAGATAAASSSGNEEPERYGAAWASSPPPERSEDDDDEDDDDFDNSQFDHSDAGADDMDDDYEEGDFDRSQLDHSDAGSEDIDSAVEEDHAEEIDGAESEGRGTDESADDNSSDGNERYQQEVKDKLARLEDEEKKAKNNDGEEPGP